MLLFLGCGPKVMIPPRIDLTRYHQVGVVGFDCNADGKMDECFTRSFLLRIRSYQKDARIIDLNGQKDVLESVQSGQIDPETIRAIGRKYDLSAVFTGRLQVMEIQPLLVLGPWGPRPTSGTTKILGRDAKAVVKVRVSARLWETETGNMIWNASVQGEDMVHQVKVRWDGTVDFDARDLPEAFRDLIRPLVQRMCVDFKINYERVRKRIATTE
jgi:hypothetical protein